MKSTFLFYFETYIYHCYYSSLLYFCEEPITYGFCLRYNYRMSFPSSTYRGCTKQWKHYRYCTDFFINMVLGYLVPSIQPQPFLEWTPTIFKPSLAEFYTILLEEYLKVVYSHSLPFCATSSICEYSYIFVSILYNPTCFDLSSGI
jgi:hypothetical protein